MMREKIRLSFAAVAALAGACGADKSPPATTASQAVAAAPARQLATPIVGSVDERGVPRLIWGAPASALPALSAEDAARFHLTGLAAEYGLSDAALATVRAVRTIRTSSGVT